MAFDAQTAWTRLGAFVASKPSHGRQDLLAEMATIADECTFPEDDFRRALRLAMPALTEALLDSRQDTQHTVPAASALPAPAQADRAADARTERPTMAVV